MQIVKVPNDVLTTPSKVVEKIDKKTLEFVEEMKKTLTTTVNPKGVGLAAPQVGAGVRIFLIKPAPASKVTVFINPQITWTSDDKTKGVPQRDKKFEGCLSIPNVWGVVHRNQSLRISFFDELGKKHTKLFKGFPATIIQHETDHIDGILFTRRVLEQKHKLYKVAGKDEEGNDKFEEIEI